MEALFGRTVRAGVTVSDTHRTVWHEVLINPLTVHKVMEGILEVFMLLCFATAWPFSIRKLYVTGENGGKSIVFSYFILAGYVFGILNKVINDSVNYVLFFYVMDLMLVLTDMCLYYRNVRRNGG